MKKILYSPITPVFLALLGSIFFIGSFFFGGSIGNKKLSKSSSLRRRKFKKCFQVLSAVFSSLSGLIFLLQYFFPNKPKNLYDYLLSVGFKDRSIDKTSTKLLRQFPATFTALDTQIYDVLVFEVSKIVTGTDLIDMSNTPDPTDPTKVNVLLTLIPDAKNSPRPFKKP